MSCSIVACGDADGGRRAVTQVCMLLQDVNCGPPVSFWPDISWQGRGSAGKLRKPEDVNCDILSFQCL